MAVAVGCGKRADNTFLYKARGLEMTEVKLNLTTAQAMVIAELLGVVDRSSDSLWKEQRHGLTSEECEAIRSHVIHQIKEQAVTVQQSSSEKLSAIEYDLQDVASEISRLAPFIDEAKELASSKILSESARDLFGVYCEFFDFVKRRECMQYR